MKKFIIGILIGVIFSSVSDVIAASMILSKDVIYDNTNSGITSTNVQGAMDELYAQVTEYELFESRIINKIYPVDMY